jgi:fibronectin-binding autotransporter adhesin
MINRGTLSWQTTSTMQVPSGAVVVNEGTWEIAQAAIFIAEGNTSILWDFVNTGTVTRTTSGTTATIYGRFANQGGTIHASFGTLALDKMASLTNGSSLSAGSGAILTMRGVADAPGSLSGSTSVTGPGTVNMTGEWALGGADVEILGPLNFSATIDTTGGSIRMGGFFWTQGGFAGDGSATVGGTVTVTTTSQKTASLGFVNEGTLLWGGGNLIVPENAVVVNEGVWDFQNTVLGLSVTGSSSLLPFVFTNAGSIVKSGSSGVTISGSFTNQATGTVDAQVGTMSLSRVAAAAGGSVWSADSGATLTATGATGLVGPGTVVVQGPGTVTWAGVLGGGGCR